MPCQANGKALTRTQVSWVLTPTDFARLQIMPLLLMSHKELLTKYSLDQKISTETPG